MLDSLRHTVCSDSIQREYFLWKSILKKDRLDDSIKLCLLRSLINVVEEQSGRFNDLWNQLEELEVLPVNALTRKQINEIF